MYRFYVFRHHVMIKNVLIFHMHKSSTFRKLPAECYQYLCYVGLNSGFHPSVVWNFYTNWHFRSTTIFTLNENIVRKPTKTCEVIQWFVSFQSALDLRGNYGSSPLILNRRLWMCASSRSFALLNVCLDIK